jgi:antirestriction protein ArdC
MNQYGAQAMRYWQENLPRQYRQIADPETFFDEMGEQVAQEIHELTRQVAGPDQLDEGFMGKVGRLQMARVEAETEIMRQMLPQPEDEQAPPASGSATGG